MRHVLVIEDEKDLARIIADEIEQSILGVSCETETNFDTGASLAAEMRPDAIVLDLMEGNQSANLPGQRTWASVWDKSFCPVVIYTGSDADLDPPVPADHPFVKRVKKGTGTVAMVVAELKGFLPAVEAIRMLRSEVDAVIQKVLRDTAGAGFVQVSNTAHLLHASRRRIAASMDDPTISGQRAMISWEQYLMPAVGDSPLTADLLRKHGAQIDDPRSYRLVLTPSCDLIKGRCEPTLIVACCEDTGQLAKKLSLSLREGKQDKDIEMVIAKALTVGVFAGFLPLPSFPPHLPVMVANLKRLEVIPYESIGCNDPTKPCFDRVASIDSPFREQIAWSFMTTAARPGMPDRDMQPWAEEVVKDARSKMAPN